jgi:hypothetical protein
MSLFQNPVGFGTGSGKKLFQKLKFWNSLDFETGFRKSG